MMKKIALAATLTALSSQAFAYDLNKMTWDEIVTQAKEEKMVSAYIWYLQPEFRKFFRQFEAEYGIKVRVPEGNESGNRNKLLAEGKREKGNIDVMALDTVKLPMMVNSGVVYGPLTNILPGSDKLRTKLVGVDTKGYGYAFWGNQTGFAYDPMRVDEATLPQTFDQLTTWVQTHPEQFGVNDPNKGGAGNAFIQRAIYYTSGKNNVFFTNTMDKTAIKSWSKAWDWFDQNEDNIIITSSNADSLTRINDGEISMAPAWEDHLAGLQKKGAITKRIKFYIPEFGMPGGGNIIMIPKNAKNKAAAALFINWITSAKVQTELNATFGAAPQHPDSDDSNALVDQAQRGYSSEFFTSDYAKEAKKEFVENVLM
ncbi:extracellular solute-binding protein [Vibrio sp. SS-MA-C1-2]|uniref:extracellular solute-binding protein n=1 Tax=Vibrio sp. SS-MA-C1-2 TaxID=2908646 RepID=UPI001F259584|nr:extracellular solute-binding protein [Vibrio sp. SS-MA-C1-2]UJF17983.1 extracellular solute-binding protein [Vibrio sp. SS-MA-C1-2]